MNCEFAQQKIALFAYGELPDDQCPELEGHLTTCSRCREEFAAVQALQQAMALAPTLEPSANLLAQARMRLEEAIDTMPRSGWIMRAQQSMVRGVSMLSRAPIAASALLIFGLACGGAGGYESALHAQRPLVVESPAAMAGPGEIANVSSIVQEPNTENVEVRFNRLVPETVQGSLDDAKIRSLLLLAAQSQVNPGVEKTSFDLLARECEAGHQCPEGPLRGSLMVALRFDKDAGVRLRALEGLKRYVADDMRVRDAVLESLMSDPNASVRSRAIALLQPVEADSSVQEVLHTVAQEDDNPHIRTVSREVLEEPTQIQ